MMSMFAKVSGILGWDPTQQTITLILLQWFGFFSLVCTSCADSPTGNHRKGLQGVGEQTGELLGTERNNQIMQLSLGRRRKGGQV